MYLLFTESDEVHECNKYKLSIIDDCETYHKNKSWADGVVWRIGIGDEDPVDAVECVQYFTDNDVKIKKLNVGHHLVFLSIVLVMFGDMVVVILEKLRIVKQRAKCTTHVNFIEIAF